MLFCGSAGAEAGDAVYGYIVEGTERARLGVQDGVRLAGGAQVALAGRGALACLVEIEPA